MIQEMTQSTTSTKRARPRPRADDSLVVLMGKRIRALRNNRKISLREFGKIAGVHPFHVMEIENGKVSATTTTIRAIAKGLGVAAIDLLNHNPEAGDVERIVELLRLHPELIPDALGKLGAAKRWGNEDGET